MISRLQKRWENKPSCFSPLTGCSFIYEKFVLLRRSLYQKNFFKIKNFPVPIIIIGNLTTGGTGKTPMTAWLVNWLKSLGYNPGLVSRGYGGKSKKWPQPVFADSDPNLVGDEPVMLVKQTGSPMWVGPNRVKAVKSLLVNHACDIIVSDDGLQHYALGRQLEIVMVDGELGFGNEYCLPAGPLREPLSKLKEVDFLISTNRLLEEAWEISYKTGNIYNLNNPNLILLPSALQNKKVHAVAGIGNPKRFFNQLAELNIIFEPHIFPDHHRYCLQDLSFAKEAVVIMTEKDAVKCCQFNQPNYWCLQLIPKLDATLVEELENRITEIMATY